MKPFRSSFGSVVRINIDLLVSAICGFTAWAIWPQSPEWWGFGVLSVILAISAVLGVIKAGKEAFALYARQRVIADYLAQGAGPKPARMVDHQDLKRAGMLDE